MTNVRYIVQYVLKYIQLNSIVKSMVINSQKKGKYACRCRIRIHDLPIRNQTRYTLSHRLTLIGHVVKPFNCLGGLCVYLTMHSDIPIRCRGIQIVNFNYWPTVQDTGAPPTHDKPGSLTYPVYSTDTRKQIFL